MSTANEKQIAEKIRSQYTERKVSKLDELKELDQRVKCPAKVFTYLFGCVSALVLGTGMCLAMKVIGDLMVPGIVVVRGYRHGRRQLPDLPGHPEGP